MRVWWAVGWQLTRSTFFLVEHHFWAGSNAAVYLFRYFLQACATADGGAVLPF